MIVQRGKIDVGSGNDGSDADGIPAVFGEQLLRCIH